MYVATIEPPCGTFTDTSVPGAAMGPLDETVPPCTNAITEAPVLVVNVNGDAP